ncbi:helix-turn-helix domain-containing protein [Pullulanibacillus sp. KACC 23026]|uniref:ArsR/SmtB family transcription factor n=1 Tax=Pullulanibacillus sp. KACC 23026 TaxID=3028315 RepID=UPI0023B110FE|nr:ArsR family transcriptional regulator [Pullulanibacillus sp. KACC 23026]WEG11890.1 helix-turn-helix domain-containing protein [Pullulanibacillus sp. KACC 23026]
MELNLTASDDYVSIYEALASPVRLKIIRLLSEKAMNNTELAEQLSLSKAIVTMHVNKLSDAGIITTELKRVGKTTTKISTLALNRITIDLPVLHDTNNDPFYEMRVPVGHYTDFLVRPTCGLATTEKIIGHLDDPRYFLDPARMNAGIVWLGTGFLEYKVPNYLLASDRPKTLEITMEIASEAPSINEDWPSDISFYMNSLFIGTWTSPGDFGESRGIYTPRWWPRDINQHGLRKIIRIDDKGTFIDGEKLSTITINQLDLRQKYLTFRLSVPEDANHPGGLTLYGQGFGNYNEDLVFRLYYSSSQFQKA